MTTLKIDRSFVTGIADDAEARSVCEAVVHLGEAFKMTVVAEGIETADQAAALIDMGCSVGQGSYFHYPLPPPEAAALIHQQFVNLPVIGEYADPMGQGGHRSRWRSG